MATFETRGSTTRAQVRLSGQSVSGTFDTAREARAWASEQERRIKAGEIVSRHDGSNDPTVAWILERYAREVSPTKRGVSTEKKIVRRLLGADLKHFSKRASKYGTDDAAAWVQERAGQVSGSTIRREAAVVKVALRHACRSPKDAKQPGWGYAFRGGEFPFDGVKIPKQNPSRSRRLEDGELAALLTHLGYECGTTPTNSPQWVAWVLLFNIATAMRVGAELLNARWRDLDRKNETMRLALTKNGEERHVPLTAEAFALLDLIPQGEPDDFIAGIRYANLNKIFSVAKRELGIDNLHFYDSRREAISRAAESGALNILELKAFSGHKRTEMLEIYYKPRPRSIADKLNKAAANGDTKPQQPAKDLDAWKKGYRAGMQGKAATDCPYDLSTPQAFGWLAGFVEAQRESA